MRIRLGLVFAAVLAVPMQGCGNSASTATPASGGTPSRQLTLPSEEATQPRPSLGVPALQVPGWEGVVVRTLCLDAQMSLDDPVMEDAIRGGLEEMLAEWGIEIVGATASCDAELGITLTGQATAARYSSDWCYTAGETAGNVTFSGSGRTPIEFAIDFSWGRPFVITSCPRTPRESSLCAVAARQVFRRVVHLWDVSELAADPTAGTISKPSYGPLVGGRTWEGSYVTWCASLPAA